VAAGERSCSAAAAAAVRRSGGGLVAQRACGGMSRGAGDVGFE
jgi:hypothetical protein